MHRSVNFYLSLSVILFTLTFLSCNDTKTDFMTGTDTGSGLLEPAELSSGVLASLAPIEALDQDRLFWVDFGEVEIGAYKRAGTICARESIVQAHLDLLNTIESPFSLATAIEIEEEDDLTCVIVTFRPTEEKECSILHVLPNDKLIVMTGKGVKTNK